MAQNAMVNICIFWFYFMTREMSVISFIRGCHGSNLWRF